MSLADLSRSWGLPLVGALLWSASLSACLRTNAGPGSGSGGSGAGASGGSSGTGGQTGAGGQSNAGGFDSGAAGGIGLGGASYAIEELCFEFEEVPACSEGTPPWSTGEPAVLAVAESVAEGARFIALGGQAALLEVPGAAPSEKYRVVLGRVVEDYATDVALGIDWPDAVGAWSVRHALAESGVSVYLGTQLYSKAFALACDEVGCRLFGADSGDKVLLPIPGLDVLPTARVDRLAFGLREDVVCAFAEDFYCARGTKWERIAVVPSGAGTRFEHVLFGPYYTDDGATIPGMAATDSGALMAEQAPGEWIVARASEQDRVLALERSGDRVSVLFESGLWFPDFLEDASASCSLGIGVSWASPGGYGDTWVVTDESGAAYWGAYSSAAQSASWCRPFEAPATDTFAWSRSGCGSAPWLLALSEARFVAPLGPPVCGEVP